MAACGGWPPAAACGLRPPAATVRHTCARLRRGRSGLTMSCRFELPLCDACAARVRAFAQRGGRSRRRRPWRLPPPRAFVTLPPALLPALPPRWKRGGLRFAASAFALTTYLSRRCSTVSGTSLNFFFRQRFRQRFRAHHLLVAHGMPLLPSTPTRCQFLRTSDEG